jgi:hypothetical protein
MYNFRVKEANIAPEFMPGNPDMIVLRVLAAPAKLRSWQAMPFNKR